MGYNTTVVVYNDALDQIASDPQFGKNLATAIKSLPEVRRGGRDAVDVPAGNHSNAARVVETHHADYTVVITVGGNLGVAQASRHGYDHHTTEGAERMLRAWADKLGFELTPKRT